MVIYKVAYFDSMHESFGFSFHSSLRSAMKAKNKSDFKKNSEVTFISVKPTKKDIISMLSYHACHHNNG